MLPRSRTLRPANGSFSASSSALLASNFSSDMKSYSSSDKNISLVPVYHSGSSRESGLSTKMTVLLCLPCGAVLSTCHGACFELMKELASL